MRQEQRARLPEAQLRSMDQASTKAVSTLGVLDWTWYSAARRTGGNVAAARPQRRAARPAARADGRGWCTTRPGGRRRASTTSASCDFSTARLFEGTRDGRRRDRAAARVVVASSANTQQQLKAATRRSTTAAAFTCRRGSTRRLVVARVHAGGLRRETVEQALAERENATIGGRRMFRRMWHDTARRTRVASRAAAAEGSSPGQWASGKVGLVSGTLTPGGKGGGARLKDSGVPELVVAAKLAQQGCGPLLGKCSGGKRARLSTTAHLLKAAPRPGCEVLLGVGHLHRRDGDMLRGRGEFRCGGAALSAGVQLYTLRLRAGGGAAARAGRRRWCIASPEQGRCESVQFVAGIALEGPDGHPPDRLLPSYGVNDCEADSAASRSRDCGRASCRSRAPPCQANWEYVLLHSTACRPPRTARRVSRSAFSMSACSCGSVRPRRRAAARARERLRRLRRLERRPCLRVECCWRRNSPLAPRWRSSAASSFAADARRSSARRHRAPPPRLERLFSAAAAPHHPRYLGAGLRQRRQRARALRRGLSEPARTKKNASARARSSNPARSVAARPRPPEYAALRAVRELALRRAAQRVVEASRPAPPLPSSRSKAVPQRAAARRGRRRAPKKLDLRRQNCAAAVRPSAVSMVAGGGADRRRR